ncbi:MAG TPA: hypothetical protein VEB41_11055 [Burkholderiales bacterium]|nr:hypothetical protein [Burkholderiales bacterium]
MANALLARWEEFRPTKTQAFWLAAGCVAATLALGFGPGGWVTGATAQKQVAKAAEDARHELAAAICVDEFMAAAGARDRLASLQKLTWYARSEKIAQAGWATMPDRKEPNTTVAIACASRLSELPAVAKH